MTDLFFKRTAITGAIESIIADLEIRQQETIRMHIKNLYHIHNFVHEQFELIINEKSHKKDNL